MGTKKTQSPGRVANGTKAAAASRVALTLKVTKSDYVRLSKLRLKLLESGRDVSHQDILYDALETHLQKHHV